MLATHGDALLQSWRLWLSCCFYECRLRSLEAGPRSIQDKENQIGRHRHEKDEATPFAFEEPILTLRKELQGRFEEPISTRIVIGTDSVFSSRLGLRLENLLQVDSTQVELCSKFGQKVKSTRLGEVRVDSKSTQAGSVSNTKHEAKRRYGAFF